MIQIRNYRFTRADSIAALGIAAAFAVSLVFFLVRSDGSRRICYFESLDEPGVFTEIRYMPSSVEPDFSAESGVRFFVEDILLGPLTHRFRPLFVPGTQVQSCFVRGGVLYVDLSAQALQAGGVVSSIKDGTDVFMLNVLKNFPRIKTVELFIDGKRVYEDVSGN